MIKQRQKSFGEKKGSCFSTCVACLLNMPAENVPNWCAEVPENEDWFMAAQHWLDERGYVLVNFDCQPDGGLPENLSAMVDGQLCICGGKSPRGNWLHEVIGRYRHDEKNRKHWIDFIHDPHPSNKFIDSLKDVAFLFRKLP